VNDPAFFLTSRDEWSWITPVRACRVVDEVPGDPVDLSLVELDPPGDGDVRRVLLAARHEGEAWPPTDFPAIANLFEAPSALTPPVRLSELRLRAIVELHGTRESAEAVAATATW
jgi:hypothetical protein